MIRHDANDYRHGATRVEDGAPGKHPVSPRPLLTISHEGGASVCWFTSCALLAQPHEWTEELRKLGVRQFKTPEALYKVIRNREFAPAVCLVDLDSVARNAIRTIDLRVPCPKLWLGKSAASPADVKNFGIYYSRIRPDELNGVVGRLIQLDRSIMLPAGFVGRQTLPFLVSDDAYRERLHHYADLYAAANLITLHGDDQLELHLVAQYLAVEAQRARIWEVKSGASIHSVLRKIAQARRPGTDVSIVMGPDIDTESAREFHKSMPAEYSMIKLSPRSANAVDALSFTIPKPAERPADVENWITSFIGRSTVENGVALSGLENAIRTIVGTLGDDPGIEEIRSLSEQVVRQHATLAEDQGGFVSYEDIVNNFERTLLRRSMTQHDWNLSATAKSLGLAESSLRYKLNKLGVVRNDTSD